MPKYRSNLKMLLFVPILCLLSVTKSLSAAEFQKADNLNISGSFSDNLFAAGGTIDAKFNSTDDFFMASGDISILDSKSELGAIAGGSISITNSELRELIIAGGNIRLIETRILDDLIMAGGQINIGSQSKILGTAVIAGGNIVIAGHFSKNLRIYADKLHITKSATIEGDLIHSVRNLIIDPNAEVKGQTIARIHDIEKSPVMGGFGFFMAALFFIGILILGPLIATLLAKIANKANLIIKEQFWASLGKGTFLMLVIPVVIAALCISVIGVPLALFIIAVAIPIKIFAWSIITYSLGLNLCHCLRKGPVEPPSRPLVLFGWATLGALILMLLMVIPFFGVFICILSMALGIGALFTLAKET